eukprot:g21023.t1
MTLLRRHIHLAEGQRISAVNQQRMLQFSEAVPEKEEMHKEAWMPMPEAESAPWVSAYQEVAANDLIGFDRYAETEVRSSSSDNSELSACLTCHITHSMLSSSDATHAPYNRLLAKNKYGPHFGKPPRVDQNS